MSCYASHGKKVKACIISAHFFTVCNHWCTSRRFGKLANVCPFCDTNTDDIKHVVICSCSQRVFHKCFGQHDLHLSIENVLLFTDCNSPLSRLCVSYCFLYIYVAFRSFNMCRHGDPLSERLVAHILKILMLHCSSSRNFIRKVRSLRVIFP